MEELNQKKVKVSDKELQDVLKTGRKTKPGRTKRITVGSLDARDKAIKDLDDLIIEPKEGDVKQTEKLIKRQRKRVVKRITTPKPGEIEQQQKILDKTQTKPKTSAQDIFDPTGEKRIKFKSQNIKFDKFMNNLKTKYPKPKISLYDPLQNKIPKLEPLKPLTIPKLKPSVVTKTATKTKLFPKLMKAASRNPKTALAVGLLGLGTYGAIKNRAAVKNMKKNNLLPAVGGGGNTITTKDRKIDLYLQTDSSRK